MDQTALNSLYQQYLGRDADPSGLATFGNQDQGAVTSALQNSEEFKNLHPEGLNNFFVNNAGKTANLAGWNNDPLQNETNFNSDAYMKANPDVAASGMSAWDHYSQYGKNEGRQASFDASPSIDPSRWVQNAYGADSNGEGGKTYYTDPRTGNAYTYSIMANPNDPSGETPLIIDPNSIKALAGGNALNDKYISLLGVDPSEAQKLYEQKQSNPSQFYSDVGDKLESNYFAGASYNHGDQTLSNAIESLKDVDPAAYYREKIKEEASWAAWDKAQGNGRDVGHLDTLKNLISQGQTSGLSQDTINSLVNSSYSDSYRGSKQEMANAASSGGGMFGDAIPAITTIAAMALAPELAPLLVGELGTVGGAVATGAILGGGSGAINAAANNGDIGQGLLKGSIYGGVGGGVAGGIGSAFSSAGDVTGMIGNDIASMNAAGATQEEIATSLMQNYGMDASQAQAAMGQVANGAGTANGIYPLADDAAIQAGGSSFGSDLAKNVASKLGSKLATTGLSALLGGASGTAGAVAGGSGSSGGSNSQNLTNSGLSALNGSNSSGSIPSPLQSPSLAGAPVYNLNPHILEQLKQLDPRILASLGIHSSSLAMQPQNMSEKAPAQEVAQQAQGNPYSRMVETLLSNEHTANPSPGMPLAAMGGSQADIIKRFQETQGKEKSGALMNTGLKMLGAQQFGGLRNGGEPEHNPEFITGTTGHYVKGKGDGQSDDIPAMLADGEYVFDADTVAALGNGSSDAGAKLLDHFRESLREHKRSASSDKIPPKASPLQYMKEALKRHSKG